MKRLILVFALCALVSSGAFAAMTLPLTDEFNAGGPNHTWDSYAGTWCAAGSGTKIVTGFNGQDAMWYDDGSGWGYTFPNADDGSQGASIIVEAWQWVPSSGASDWVRVGVGCRVQGTGWANARDSGYWVYSDSDADNYFSVGTGMQNWGGLPHARLYGPATCTRSAWHHWAIAVDGNTLVAYSDTEGAYGQVYTTNITSLDATQRWSGGRSGIGSFKYSGSTHSTYTDRIVINTWTAVDDWTLY